MSEQIMDSYVEGSMSGWPGEEIAAEEYKLIKDEYNFVDFKFFGDEPYQGPRKAFLYQVVRKVLNRDIENVRQLIGDPFRAGTMVTMADGSEKAIETLKVGDKVVNHKNEIANVTRIIKKKFTGDMVTIKLKGWHRELTATEEHHGMILPFSGRRFKYSRCERRKFGQMNVGDYVMISHGMDKNEEIILDLKDYTTDCEYGEKTVSKQYEKNNRIYKFKHTVNRFIKVDNKFARFLGLYLAEGGSAKNGQVSFSFNKKETYFGEEVIAYFKEIFGVDAKYHKTGNDNCFRVCVSSAIIKEFLCNVVGDHTLRKKIPTFMFNVSRSVKMDLIKGWLDGDGCKKFKVNSVIGYTSSNQLGIDMSRLAVSCRLNPKIWKRKRKKYKENAELAFFGSECESIYGSTLCQSKVKKITCNNTPYGFARKIENIKREYVVDEEVYCITTENEFTAIFNGMAQYQCVSWGGRNACEYLACCDILMRGDHESYHPVFPPYYYGTSRVQIGGGRLSTDGSLGSWLAAAVMKYGTLFSDEHGVPNYGESVARNWGKNGPPDQFMQVGKKYLVKSAAQIKNWEELVEAICNGYPCTVASDQGFEMTPDANGFHNPKGTWQHQMCITGIDDEWNDPYALIRNSWGDVHGKMVNFHDKNEVLPAGYLRVRKKTIERMINQKEVFAWSQFDGFQMQDINKGLFKIFGE